ncbi:MAG: EamA family transporter [Candidatus Woesearchaeota archaeon]
MTSFISILLVIISSPISAYAAILLKRASKSLKLRNFYQNKQLLIGLFLYGCAALTYIFALKGAELSVLYPLVSLTYVWTVILSAKLLKEKINSSKWLGVAMILVGVSLIGFGS